MYACIADFSLTAIYTQRTEHGDIHTQHDIVCVCVRVLCFQWDGVVVETHRPQIHNVIGTHVYILFS